MTLGFTVKINEFHNDPFYNNDKSIDAAAEPIELISPDNDSSAIQVWKPKLFLLFQVWGRLQQVL